MFVQLRGDMTMEDVIAELMTASYTLAPKPWHKTEASSVQEMVKRLAQVPSGQQKEKKHTHACEADIDAHANLPDQPVASSTVCSWQLTIWPEKNDCRVSSSGTSKSQLHSLVL
jgi:hypothetical protein